MLWERRTFQSSLPTALVALAALLSPAEALAQVNVEALRADLRQKPALASLEGSFTGRTGNVESVVVGGAAFGAARFGRHAMFLTSQADYARFNGQTQVSKSFLHARYDYGVTDVLFGEVFAQQQQDKFQRLLLRELVGAGPRFLLADEDAFRFAVGTAYMFEYERINVPAGAPDPSLSTAHRWTSYATGTWSPDKRVRATGTIYVQPRFDEPSDARILAEGSVGTDITGRLGVKVISTIRYDSAPPTTVKTTDIEVKNAFVLKF